jgi:protein-S-isoprenylcysteine O-methyltransferase Ste14
VSGLQWFSRRGGWWVVAQFVLFAAYLGALWVGRGGSPAPVVAVTGGVLAAAGAVQALAGLRGLGAGLSVFPTPVDGADLVAHGIFRFVRHPIYGGIVLGGMGLALLAASPFAAAVDVLLAWFFWNKAGFEERHLVARHPGYVEYRSRVRHRLVPGVL